MKKLSIFRKLLLGENLSVSIEPVADDAEGFTNGLRAFSRSLDSDSKADGVVYRMPDRDGKFCFGFALSKLCSTSEEEEEFQKKVVMAALFSGFSVTLVGEDEVYEMLLSDRSSETLDFIGFSQTKKKPRLA